MNSTHFQTFLLEVAPRIAEGKPAAWAVWPYSEEKNVPSSKGHTR